MSTAQDLAELDWHKIYHTGPIDYSRPEESDITSRRNAEVIIPSHLDMNSLKWIYCRSEAEKDTLLHLLTDAQRSQYKRRILATARNELFYKQHTYLESVRLDSEVAYLSFSPETQSPGPFHLQIIIRSGDDTRQHTEDAFTFQTGEFRWNIRTGFDDYEFELRLDGNLVYRNRHIEFDDIPF